MSTEWRGEEAPERGESGEVARGERSPLVLPTPPYAAAGTAHVPRNSEPALSMRDQGRGEKKEVVDVHGPGVDGAKAMYDVQGPSQAQWLIQRPCMIGID